jgi:membrane protease YdiL (CAAX protease family)
LLFSLAHGFNPINIIIGTVLFSVPLAFIYNKYGFEAAVGHHFLTDLIRYLVSVM